jgi:feruloyl-CoA synthase
MAAASTIDQGKPTKAVFSETVRNVIIDDQARCPSTCRSASAMLVHEMEDNHGAARRRISAELDLLFYAGASLPQEVWTRLEEMAREVRGRLPLMISSWGMTETAPATLMVHEPIGRSGVIGVPLPGTEIKLAG